jgi:imidazolonepropionase-like amidohydrolase
VKHLHDAGVVLTIGTDANNPWVVPGVSFHRELQLFADAGIPPAALLRMATRNGAEALGVGHETGTIEPGKRADLVLLRRDPLSNIVNTTSIEWVMQGGRRWEPAVLLQRQHEDPVANTGRILAAR